MKVCAFQLNPHIHSPKPSHPIPTPKLTTTSSPLKPTPSMKATTSPLSINTSHKSPFGTKPNTPISAHQEVLEASHGGIPSWVFLSGASLGLALLILGVDGQHEALALGPEGPLVEEFWDNMRRYGLYILTVSTGAIYTIFQPIVELLKNPITAILIITVVVGSGYLVSQVLSAMVGISEFSYNYGY